MNQEEAGWRKGRLNGSDPKDNTDKSLERKFKRTNARNSVPPFVRRRKEALEKGKISYHYHSQHYPEIMHSLSADEIGWTSSDEAFDANHIKGTLTFVGLQLAASAALLVHGVHSGDMPSTILAGGNLTKNVAWLGAHLAVKQEPKIMTAPAFARARLKKTWARAVKNCSGSPLLLKSWREALERRGEELRFAANDDFQAAQKERERLTGIYQSKIFRDAKHAAINKYGAGAGALLHSVQMFSEEILVAAGGALATASYGGMADDQRREAKKWRRIFERMRKNNPEKLNMSYDHKDAEILVGYGMNGQPGKEALYKVGVPLGLAGKGGLYLGEAVIANDIALGVSGLLFLGVGLNEVWEANRNKLFYAKEIWQMHSEERIKERKFRRVPQGKEGELSLEDKKIFLNVAAKLLPPGKKPFSSDMRSRHIDEILEERRLAAEKNTQNGALVLSETSLSMPF